MTAAEELREHALYDRVISVWSMKKGAFRVIFWYFSTAEFSKLSPVERRMFCLFAAEFMEQS